MDWQKWADEELNDSERALLAESAHGRLKNSYAVSQLDFGKTAVNSALTQFARHRVLVNLEDGGLYENPLFGVYRDVADKPLLQLVIDDLRENHADELDEETRSKMRMMEDLMEEYDK